MCAEQLMTDVHYLGSKQNGEINNPSHSLHTHPQYHQDQCYAAVVNFMFKNSVQEEIMMWTPAFASLPHSSSILFLRNNSRERIGTSYLQCGDQTMISVFSQYSVLPLALHTARSNACHHNIFQYHPDRPPPPMSLT